MRQTHVVGDKAPVIVDRLTSEPRQAQISVAVLGASNFTFAEPTWTQGLSDRIGAHTARLRRSAGVAAATRDTTLIHSRI